MKKDMHKRFFFNMCKFVYKNDSIKGERRSIDFTLDLLLFKFHYSGGWKCNSISIRVLIFSIALMQGFHMGNKIRVTRYDFDPYHVSLQLSSFNCAIIFGVGLSISVFRDYQISYLLWRMTPEKRKELSNILNDVLDNKDKGVK